MTKKNFKTSFDSLLGEDLPKQNNKNITKEIRATFIVREFNLEKLKAISYWERKKIKNVLDEALSTYIELYEKEKGAIQLPSSSEK